MKLSNLIRNLFRLLSRHIPLSKDRVFILDFSHRTVHIQDIHSRLHSYLPDHSHSRTYFISKISPLTRLSLCPILVIGRPTSKLSSLSVFLSNSFLVDHELHPAAMEWIHLHRHFSSHRYSKAKSFANLLRFSRQFALRPANSCHIYGTAPSLALSLNNPSPQGLKVVCNTIVRDQILFQHLQPDIIVAGDPLYHFSSTDHAKAFRRDLTSRLEESNCLFAYPSIFHSIVYSELSHLSDRLVGIPIGKHITAHSNLIHNFSLPCLGNVLPLLLLPLATTFSQDIVLHGFDGRDPSDHVNPFWANSTHQSYPELIPLLQRDYPAFFRTFVPMNNSTTYINSVHGDQLDSLLTAAENKGFSFRSETPSWTPTIHQRYNGTLSPAALRSLV